MYPRHVLKIGTERTRWGEVVVLLIDNQRAIAFPSIIDDSDRDAIDAAYSTFYWPLGWPLSNLPNFPEGPPLHGWDILGCFKGDNFAYPPGVEITNGSSTPSVFLPSDMDGDITPQTKFCCVEAE